MNYIVVTQLKNQSKRIREWILYHYNEGFDGFMIYDDFSEDSTEEEIIKVRDEYGINIILKKTDGIGNSYNIENCGNSDSYGGDRSLSDRILRTINDAYEIATNMYPNSYCAFIDVDEFIVTSSEKKVTEVLQQKFDMNYKQILIRNIDVLHNYELSNWYTSKTDLKIWSYDDLRNTWPWNTRNKAVLKSGFCKRLGFIHIPCEDGNKEDYTLLEDNFDDLRLLHFRIPNLATMTWVSDNVASEKFKKVFKKYEQG